MRPMHTKLMYIFIPASIFPMAVVAFFDSRQAGNSTAYAFGEAGGVALGLLAAGLLAGALIWIVWRGIVGIDKAPPALYFLTACVVLLSVSVFVGSLGYKASSQPQKAPAAGKQLSTPDRDKADCAVLAFKDPGGILERQFEAVAQCLKAKGYRYVNGPNCAPGNVDCYH